MAMSETVRLRCVESACGSMFEVPFSVGSYPERCPDCRLARRRQIQTESQRRRRQRERTQLAAVEPAVVPTPAVDLGHLVQWFGIAAQARQAGRSEAERTRLALEMLRSHELSFADAWAVATRGRESEELAFARSAFERAYLGAPATTLDRCAARLGAALEGLVAMDEAAPRGLPGGVVGVAA